MPQDVPDRLGVDALMAGQDTTDQAADTLFTTPTIDDESALDQFGRGVEEARRLAQEGEWALFWDILFQSGAELLVNFVPNLLQAVLLLVILVVLYRVADRLLTRMLDRASSVEPGLQSLLLKSFRVVALVLIGISVLQQFNIDVTALLAGLSIAGIALGFAARDTLENFISGVTILLDRPFRVGDRLEIEDTYGRVEEITLRSTRIRTLRDQIMVMPNIQMINQKLINHSMLGTVRVDVPFGIAYKEHPKQAREIVMEMMEEEDPRIDYGRKPTVVVTALNDSSVDMMLYFFLRNPDLEVPVRFEYIEKVREALREHDVEIPFPHLQLFVDEAQAFEDSFLMAPTLQRPSAPPSSTEADA
ncbi:MAG: mechanosensitive ion channel [Bacteroidetes bacterium]|nr:mechanosensitive ion channel [Bacteroidota bacterium]